MNSVSTSIFLFPRGLESRFEAFFQFRPWPKCSFRRFSFFDRGRNAVFTVFYSSGTPESQFSPFSRFRPCPKRCFCCFLLIRALGKPFFSVFCSSEPSESHFFCFLLIRDLGKLFFYLRRPSGTPILRITLQRKEKYRI